MTAHLDVDGGCDWIVVASYRLLHVQFPAGAEVEFALEHFAAVGVGVELVSIGHIGLVADLSHNRRRQESIISRLGKLWDI